MNGGLLLPPVDQVYLRQQLRRASEHGTSRSSTTCKGAIIYLGEVDTYRIGGTEIEDSLRTDRGRGVGIWLSMQSLPKDEDLAEAAIQNTGVKIVHRCASKDTAFTLAECMLSELDREKVHHYRITQKHDGFDIQPTYGSSRDKDGNSTERIGETFVPRYRDEKEPVYESLSDQLTLLVREIQNLAVGERIVIDARSS